jgi:GT2 family glycosyltransferase
VVVHWHGETQLAALAAAWPDDPRFELLVVDNGSRLPLAAGPGRVLAPGRNLGFAGGANLGIAEARAPLVLLLNPDAVPEPGALERLLEGFACWPDAAGLAPRLTGAGGESQHRWQLRPLPSPASLLLHAFFLPGGRGPAAEPPPGAPIEQPAGAALALRREAVVGIGGLDPAFHPAWFEDVDLARRLRQRGAVLRYWPAAVFRHRLGASVEELGYGSFLALYSRNLVRYLRKHHGRGWAAAARLALALGACLRLAALPLRRPRRARSRRQAASGLWALVLHAATGWRRVPPVAQ